MFADLSNRFARWTAMPSSIARAVSAEQDTTRSSRRSKGGGNDDDDDGDDNDDQSQIGNGSTTLDMSSFVCHRTTRGTSWLDAPITMTPTRKIG